MNKKKLALIGSVIFFAVTAVVYILQIGGTTTQQQANIPYLTAPALAVLSALAAVKLYRLSSKEGVVFALLAAGIACFFLGEILFSYFQFVTETDPFPSIADVFFILGYPLIFWGLVKEAVNHKVSWRDFNKFGLTLFVLFGLTLAFLVAFFGWKAGYDAEAPLINNVIALAYPVGDLFLIVPMFFILKVAADFKGGKLFYSWTFVFIALLCLLVGDILFAVYTDQYAEALPGFTAIDLTWVAMYLLFAYSFFYTTQTVKELQFKLKKPTKPAVSPTAKQ